MVYFYLDSSKFELKCNSINVTEIVTMLQLFGSAIGVKELKAKEQCSLLH